MSDMNVFDAIHGRRAIHRFTDAPIPPDVLAEIVEAARWAPYGTRDDDRTLVVLGGDEKAEFLRFVGDRLEKLLPALGEGASRQILRYARTLVNLLKDAPVLVLFYTAVRDEGPELSLPSVATAAQNMMLAAYARGVASCYMTGAIYLADDIADFLGVTGQRLVATVPLGYAASKGATRKQFPRIIWRGIEGMGQSDEWPEVEPAEVTSAARVAEGDDPEVILIIDDSPGALAQTADILRGAGYEVIVCETPAMALPCVERDEPDLVLVDAILPDLSGYEICRSIEDGKDGPLPVIITTSAYDADDERRALAVGAAAVLTKPIASHELLARVRSLLDMRGLYKDLQSHADELSAANERLRELQELRDALTHMIIHDLRTPLTNILTGLQTVEVMDYDREMSEEFIPAAIHAGLDLGDMISNLLDISKMESGELDPKLAPTPLIDIADSARERVGLLAEEADLELVTQIEDGLTACADSDLLVRVVVNLLGNAIKFTPGDGTVSLQASARDDGMVLVAVRDTGEGIPPEELPRVFEKFSQVKREGKPIRKGTGLGLTFVKMAVEAHGGEIWVESQVGEGTVFSFTLPGGSDCA